MPDKSLNKEIWVDIIGYNGYYKISNFGRCISTKKYGSAMRFLKVITWNGYSYYRLCNNGKTKSERIHRLLAIHFIPNPDNKPFVNHIDGNPQNNSLQNLEWVTPRENNSHGLQSKKRSCSFIGVYYYKKYKKYGSAIYINKKRKYIGFYDTEIEAYNARLNFQNENGIVDKYFYKTELEHSKY